jgi:hypothetical protein
MPKAIMETLALIAYKSPVMQSEIIDMRGAGAYDHIGLLEEKGFISKDKFGRTFKLKIAQKFYDYFDIEGDKKLRQMFKSVKKPESLGTLEVYTEEQKNPNQDSDQAFNDNVLERMKKVEENPIDHVEQKRFLDDFDTRFDKTKTNIDQADKEMNEFRKIVPQEISNEIVHVESIAGVDSDTSKIIKKLDDEVNNLEATNNEQSEEVEEEADEQVEEQVEELVDEAESSEEAVEVEKSPVKKLDDKLKEPQKEIKKESFESKTQSKNSSKNRRL